MLVLDEATSNHLDDQAMVSAVADRLLLLTPRSTTLLPKLLVTSVIAMSDIELFLQNLAGL